LELGDEVAGFDNFDAFYPRARKEANLHSASRNPRFRLIEGDVRDTSVVARSFAEVQPEVVIHLAARAGVRPSIENPALYAAVNVQGTVHLLDAAARCQPKPRFVYASSSSVYGDRPDAPFRESDRVDAPVSPYAATKAACELMAHTFHHLHGLPVVGLRFFTAYGPRNRPDLAIAKFAALIERGEAVPMYGAGDTRRDYTYVGDVVEGVVRAIDRCAGCRVYNLGHSEPVELRRLIELLGRALGKTPRIERLPEQPGDVRQTYADSTLAAEELGFRPSTSIEEGLERFVAWFRASASA
jgi:UDP-glucuronate 4-epimerase